MQKRGAGRPRKAREVVSSDVTAAEGYIIDAEGDRVDDLDQFSDLDSE